ncbi:MAG: hypothetical protein WA003_04930 [Desulfuromonadaceae bacterium]
MAKLRAEPIYWIMVLTSAVLYGVEFLVFGRAGEIGFSLLGNLAFLPVYVLFVTLMIEQILKRRERESLRQKLNMVVGVFFSEVGVPLIKCCREFVRESPELTGMLKVSPQWQATDYQRCLAYLEQHEIHVDSRNGDLAALREFVVNRRTFMLGLLENQNLLEHDKFTDLLWAVFHLLEELEARHSLDVLPPNDLDHISIDIKRAYSNLLRVWVVYMQHLQRDYPYLFSLAVRMNPMIPDAHAEFG